MQQLEAAAGSERTRARRSRVLLAAGAIAGIGLATTGILERVPATRGLPEDAVAEVNGSVIRKARYERALSALASDRREPLRESDRRFVLDRLIEEELLVQRAIDLGLDKSNPVVRNTLVSAMIESIVSGVGQREPDARQVEAFYEENHEFFGRVDRFWVRQLRFPIGTDSKEESKEESKEDSGEDSPASEQDALRTAAQAARRLRDGERLSDLARELGSSSAFPLPDGLLPAAKLREYLGPSLTLRALELQTGDVSDPIRGRAAYHVFQMLERGSQPPRVLADVESQVRAEMRRRAGDESLRAYLERLREDAAIRRTDS